MGDSQKTKAELLDEVQTLSRRVTDLEQKHQVGGTTDDTHRRYKILADVSFEAIVLSEDGVIVDFNQQLTEMTGYSRDDLIGKSVMPFISQEYHEQVTRAIREGNIDPYEIAIIRKDGTVFPVEVKARMAVIDGRQVRATALQDISERKKTYEALRASESKFSKAFHTSPDSININRLVDGLYLEINQGFTDIMGYKAQDVLGKTSLELDIWTDPEDRARLVKGLREEGEVNNLEAVFRKKDGSTTVGLMSARVLEINGEMCILSVTRDIGDWKKAQEQIQQLHAELLAAYDETLEGWSRALNLRDVNTDKHSKRVVDMSVVMAQKAGVPEAKLVHVRRGAILHDIGKMGIPDYILLKPGPLTEDEWRIMRMHPTFGYEMLSKIPFLQPALDIPYCHHERWDGQGYPRRLKGTDIPLVARAFALVDNFDALTSDRTYRPAWNREDALAYIQA